MKEIWERIKEFLQRLLGAITEKVDQEAAEKVKSCIKVADDVFKIAPIMLEGDEEAMKNVEAKMKDMSDLLERCLENIEKDPENAEKYIEDFIKNQTRINSELESSILGKLDIKESLAKNFFGVSVNGETIKENPVSAENPFANGNSCALYTMKDDNGEEKVILAENLGQGNDSKPRVVYFEIDKETGKPDIIKSRDEVGLISKLEFASNNAELMKKMLPVMTFKDRDINTGCARLTIGTMSVTVSNTMSEVPQTLIKLADAENKIQTALDKKSGLTDKDLIEIINVAINIPESLRTPFVNDSIKEIQNQISEKNLNFDDVQKELTAISSSIKSDYKQAAFAIKRENTSQISMELWRKDRQHLNVENPDIDAKEHFNVSSSTVSEKEANLAAEQARRAQELTTRIPHANTPVTEPNSGIVGIRMKTGNNKEDIRFFNPKTGTLIRLNRNDNPPTFAVYPNQTKIDADLSGERGATLIKYTLEHGMVDQLETGKYLSRPEVQEILRTDFVLGCCEGAFFPQGLLINKLNMALETQHVNDYNRYAANESKLKVTYKEFYQYIFAEVAGKNDVARFNIDSKPDYGFVIRADIKTPQNQIIPVVAHIANDARTIENISMTIGSTPIDISAGTRANYIRSSKEIIQICQENNIDPSPILAVAEKLITTSNKLLKANQMAINKEEMKEAKVAEKSVKRHDTRSDNKSKQSDSREM